MKIYFIHTGSEQTGPYTLEELKQKGINKDTPVWKEELPDWIKAGDLPELNILFAPAPPPFIQKEEAATHLPTQKNSPAPTERKNKNLLIIIPVSILIIAAAIYFYFNGEKNKPSDVNKEKIAAVTNDSSKKTDNISEDTVKKINLDTLSNWMTTDTITGNKKNEVIEENGFTMGGIPVKDKKAADKNNIKKKEKKEIVQQEEKKPGEKINTSNETRESTPVKTKNLQITGSLRKNLLFEAVLEGKIQNPNDNVSFRNIMIVVQFINADGESLGSKQFAQSGVLGGGESISFKFKASAPKGTKTAKYNVSGSGF